SPHHRMILAIYVTILRHFHPQFPCPSFRVGHDGVNIRKRCWRKEYAKNLCLKFEPAAANGSVAWNPLDEIRVGTENEVGDV
ncbi:hypothetical protein ACSLN1_26335, partial [Escherichia coli]|uniref:hypothetical protein n=1 Tax=Escherichia coli TaxID=562 RepID=UPI003EE32716